MLHKTNLLISPIIAIYIIVSIPSLFEASIGDERIYSYQASKLFGIESDLTKEIESAEVPDERKLTYVENLEHPFLGKLFIGIGIYLTDSHRIASVVAGAVSLFFIFRIMRSLHSEVAGLLSSVIVMLDPYFAIYSRFALLDIFGLMFMLMSLSFVLESKRLPSTLSFAMAMLSKMSSIAVFPLLLAKDPDKKKAWLYYVVFAGIIIITSSSLYNHIAFNKYANPLEYASFLMAFHGNPKDYIDETIYVDPLSAPLWLIPFTDHPLIGANVKPFHYWSFAAIPMLAVMLKWRKEPSCRFLFTFFALMYLPYIALGILNPVFEWYGIVWIVPLGMMLGYILAHLITTLKTAFKEARSLSKQ